MRRGILLLLVLGSLHAQTTVYLAASGPAGVAINGATNTSPIVVSTFSPHGFSASCNTTSNVCYCGLSGVATGTGVSPANGVRECVYVDASHLSLYDTSGNPIAGTGNWWNGSGLNGTSAQYLEQLTPFTIPANPGPLGYLDGSTGDTMRRVSLGPLNGLSTLSVSGCPSACVATWQIGYDQSTGKFPMAAGQHFSITGTGTALDTCGDGTDSPGVQSPYTIASLSGAGSSWTVSSSPFACALANADYTNINLHCGPAATPNDTIGGTLSCTRISQMAYTGNILWTNLVNGSLGSGYKSIFDGGTLTPNVANMDYYATAAIRFLVDPTNSLWLDQMIYALNYDYRGGGVGYAVNSASYVNQSNSTFNYTGDPQGLALIYAVVTRSAPTSYWVASEQTAFLNRQYNDFDDPGVTACTTTNQDAANTSTHNWVLSSGYLASGTNDATHAQLPASDPHYGATNYYVNTVIQLANGYQNDYSHYTYGLITAQSNSGVLTVAGGWTQAGSVGTGVTPALNNLVSGAYTSGLTCTGSIGQMVTLQIGNGANAGFANLPLTGANTIASGTALQIWQQGSFASAPTSASPQNGAASCTGTATIATTIGTRYTIFDTVATSSTASGGTATYTFTKTASLGSSINAGDAILGYNGWTSNFYLLGYISYVTAVGSNAVTTINSTGVLASTSSPQMAWRIPQWTTGDCGRLWAAKHQGSNSYGVTGAVYGFGAQSNITSTGVISDIAANGGGADLSTWPTFELVTAPDDSRAVRDLSRTQTYMFHYGIRPVMDFDTGRLRDGAGYSIDADGQATEEFMWSMTQSIPTFPRMNYGTSWGINQSIFQMFTTLPDQQGGTPYFAGWAGSGMQSYNISRAGVATGFVFSSPFTFAPTSNNAAWLRNWSENINSSGSMWGYPASYLYPLAFLHDDPRIPDSSYTVQPHQFFFVSSGSGSVTAATGWPHLYRGDMVVSHTGWSNPSATYVAFDSATLTAAIYDAPRVGQVAIWKNGCLLCADSSPGNVTWNVDSSVVSDTFQFAGGNPYNFLPGQSVTPQSQGGIGYTPITSYTHETAGSYGQQYGDSSSRFAGACTSIAPNYNTAALNIKIDHAMECFAHQKYSGHDEFVWQFTDVALASGSPTPAIAMAKHLHYTQNGTAQAGGPGYDTGSTTYIGSNMIKSLESGSGAMTHGLLTYIESPNTISVIDDCVGHGVGGQCAPGSTYSGGNGYTHRFTIAGGSGGGAGVNKFASVVCHKVMQNLNDTAFSPVALNPDSHWTGAQCAGASSTGIGLFAVGGSTYSSITAFTPSFSGIADWIIMGLTSGTYSVTVGGAPVGGSPFTVAAGDNSIEFSSGAGQVAISSVGALENPSKMGGAVIIGGNVVIH